jgi:hypothetical protein
MPTAATRKAGGTKSYAKPVGAFLGFLRIKGFSLSKTLLQNRFKGNRFENALTEDSLSQPIGASETR